MFALDSGWTDGLPPVVTSQCQVIVKIIGSLLRRGGRSILGLEQMETRIVITGLWDVAAMREGLLGFAERRRAAIQVMVDAVPVPPLGGLEIGGSGIRWGKAQGAA